MTENNHIPESELELARKVGSILEEDRSILSIDDPLMDQITDHNKELYSRYKNELEESRHQCWERISGEIQKSPKNANSNVRVLTTSAPYLKIAAALLIAVLLSLFYLKGDFNQPEMVAQSGSTQIIHTLEDDSRVQLRPNSRLWLVEQSDDLVQYRLEGEAFFNVTKNENRQFLVDAGPGQIEVIGTSFNVREWGGETVVYLRDGSLALNSSNKAKEILLKPGEAAKVDSDLSISQPIQTDGKEFTSWKQDKIILNNRTLASVIKELEYHYSVNIEVPEQVESEILGGTLSLENRAVSLENLGIVLGGNFSSIGNDTYQFVE